MDGVSIPTILTLRFLTNQREALGCIPMKRNLSLYGAFNKIWLHCPCLFTREEKQNLPSQVEGIFHGGISEYAAAWRRAETAEMAVIVIYS